MKLIATEDMPSGAVVSNFNTIILRARIKKGPNGEKDVNDYRANPELVKKMLREAVPTHQE